MNGNITDYFDGINDLKNRRVRFVGDPEKRIREDYLRILRYYRFFGRVSNNPNDLTADDATYHAIKKNSSGLISEFNKINTLDLCILYIC